MALFGKPEETTPFVVISSNDRKNVLYMVGRAAEKAVRDHAYVLEIQFMDVYEPVVASTLYLLQRVFGWQEVDRGVTTVKNVRCVSKQPDTTCGHPENVRKQDLEHAPPLVCTEEVRKACPLYVCKSPEGILVNFVRIEQAGAIRDM